jgi:hypothetical protein
MRRWLLKLEIKILDLDTQRPPCGGLLLDVQY